VALDSPAIDAIQDQWRRVERFFSRFRNQDGSLANGVNTYATPTEFKDKLRQHIELLVFQRLDRHQPAAMRSFSRARSESPFPGLRAFTTADAPIFFGRGAETDALIARVAETHFVAVVGGSGSGKSSLVGAGLIPRLASGSMVGSARWLLPSFDVAAREWRGLRFTPGGIDDNPFTALAVRMGAATGKSVRDLVASLISGNYEVGDFCSAVAPGEREPVVLMFIDQFEELFSLCSSSQVAPFSRFLERCTRRRDVRIVATLRADFYQNVVGDPVLSRLLQQGSFPLSPPSDTLLETILRPAEQVGLEFEEGLAGSILNDVGQSPGALALLAFTLDELYRHLDGLNLITRRAYEEIGGVQGAISRRAEKAYANLAPSADEQFRRVFGELVSVDESGNATRRRSRLGGFNADARAFIDVFARERLLTISDEIEPVVEVSHEALFSHWERLASWIHGERDDLILLRQFREAAALWQARHGAISHLWSDERLKQARAVIAQKKSFLNYVEREFLQSEGRGRAQIIDSERAHW
jgi:hypothetical protein